jgi:hypothetical protein
MKANNERFSPPAPGRGRELLRGVYVDHAALARGLELDDAGLRGEDRVVAADAYAVARAEAGLRRP